MTAFRRLGLFLILMMCASTLGAQEPTNPNPMSTRGTRTVSGQVLVPGGSRGNVRITVESSTRSFHRILQADGSGSFTLSEVPIGQHWITFEAEGFTTLRETLDVPPGSGIVIVQYLMRPAPPASLPAKSKEASVSTAELAVPDDARREFKEGQALQRSQPKEARRHFEKALEKHPNFAEALGALAQMDLDEQQTEKALEKLRRAVKVNPKFADGYMVLARVLNATGQHNEALEVSQHAVQLRPNEWQGHYELGLAALSLNQIQVALSSSERIEALGGGKVAEARLLRAGIFLRQGRLKEAKEELTAFLQMAPQHPRAGLARQTLESVEQQLSPLRP